MMIPGLKNSKCSREEHHKKKVRVNTVVHDLGLDLLNGASDGVGALGVVALAREVRLLAL